MAHAHVAHRERVVNQVPQHFAGGRHARARAGGGAVGGGLRGLRGRLARGRPVEHELAVEQRHAEEIALKSKTNC